MLKIISILGKKGNGKDYVSKLIEAKLKNELNLEVKKLAFADKLKELLSLLTGIDLQLFHSQEFKKYYMINIRDFEVAKIDHRVGTFYLMAFQRPINTWVSIRELLQHFGTNVMQQAFGKNVWINAALKEIDPNKINIFTDTRFITEYKALKSQDCVTIRVINPNVKSNDNHPSEVELDEYPADYTIINNWVQGQDNADSLNDQIDLIIQDLVKWIK